MNNKKLYKKRPISQSGLPFPKSCHKCLIQEHKSTVCKQFEPGSDDCEHFRAKFLPGLNHLNEVLN